jgi:prepilin-type processing-associated H-X9-DG protein
MMHSFSRSRSGNTPGAPAHLREGTVNMTFADGHVGAILMKGAQTGPSDNYLIHPNRPTASW